MADELLYKCAMDMGYEQFEVDSFEEWRRGLKNPNLLLACDFVFNILHPIFLFRAGVRQCNDEVATASLYKASGIFYGFHHPKYRELVARDLLQMVSLPKHATSVCKRYGYRLQNSTTGQGPDFLVEERNKAQKHWIFSHGTPTQVQWKRASSTLSFFEEVLIISRSFLHFHCL